MFGQYLKYFNILSMTSELSSINQMMTVPHITSDSNDRIDLGELFSVNFRDLLFLIMNEIETIT